MITTRPLKAIISCAAAVLLMLSWVWVDGGALGQDGGWRVIAMAADQDGKLTVTALQACKSVPYFAACVGHPGVWQRDEKLYLYLQPEGLHRETTASGYRLVMRQDLMLLDAGGSELWRRDGVVKMTRETQSPLLDVFAVNRIDLAGLPAGAYHARVRVHDQLSGAVTEAEIAFVVGDAAPSVEPAP